MSSQKSWCQNLELWFNTVQGAHLANAISTKIASVRHLLHGEILLQLGDLGQNSWLSHINFLHKWIVTPHYNPHASLVSLFNYLPFEKNSIDCILAPLTLEGNYKKNNILDGIDYLLKPMGHLIIFGINPLSLWGISRHLGLWPTGVKSNHLISSFFIKKMLLPRGYVICDDSTFYFLPPLNKESWIKKLEFLDLIGKIIWPCPAGFFCIILQKYQAIEPNKILLEVTEEVFKTDEALQTRCAKNEPLVDGIDRKC